MGPNRIQLCASFLALTISLALAADWIAGEGLSLNSAPARLAMLISSVVLSAAGIALIVKNRQAADETAQNELELLCRTDVRELMETAKNEAFATPAGLDPRWTTVIEKLRHRLVEASSRLRELEAQRAAIESRARRNEAQTERMNWILSGLSEPVLAIDKYDELVLANPSAQALLTIDEKNTEQRALSKLVQCEKLVELLTDTRKRKTPSQRSCDVELTTGSESSIWYRATARNVPASADQSDGGSQGAVAVLHDISSQKALQQRNAEFVSAVSHEMKAPLSGIKAYVELLVDGDAEDEKAREKFLEIINAQADRLQRLVDNLLNIARIEAGVVRVNKQSRSLNEVLEKALQVIRPAADSKQIQLSSDLSPLYLGVYSDSDLALQAAINLLSNAVKYTPAGGQVTLRSRLADNEVRFDVEDNGVGLSSEDCQKVFEKFYRVHKDKDLAAGTGLGLPLVKHIVEDVHGGRITVHSTPGKGSVFSVFLPAAAALT
jgi:two-component system, OmpR family, phosphate regulon sensor histidine kinase PhoR